MAQTTSPYNPNRYRMSQSHSHQQHGPQQQPGYYCSNQQQQQHHHQQQQQHQQHVSLSRQHHSYMMGCFAQNSNGWAGIPLISTASRRPRKNNFNNNNNIVTGNPKHRLLVSNNSSEFDENAMSRLAIHAHGAPLILTGRYRNRMQKRDGTTKQAGGTNINSLSKKPLENTNKTTAAILNSSSSDPNNASTNATIPADTISVTSDECSSNGTAPEACLPRIIKPRKRRKKDRKPPPPNNVCLPDTISAHHHHQQQGNIKPDISQLVTREMSLNSCSRKLFNNCMESPISCHQDIRNEYPQSDMIDNLFKLQSENNEELATCCCRICDPSCRIWAFPLRRSCSDNTAELELQRSKDVGVIGSNRTSSSKNDWRSASTIDNSRSLFRNGSFSDSGDSGCDLLNGINFGDDHLFYNCQPNQISSSPIDDDRSFIDFPAAESLLTESINEISKKLMETVDLRSNNNLFASDSSSVFSDSVLSDDVLFNIEHFTINDNNNNNNHHNNTKYYCSNSDLVNDIHNHQQLINNNNINNNNNLNGNYLFSGGDNNFVMFHEKDRENEILNCFDMVWSGGGGISHGGGISGGGTNKLLPIEEHRIQLQSTG